MDMADDECFSEEELDPPPIAHIVTQAEMLDAGIKLTYSEKKYKRAKLESNRQRFLDTFGLLPATACAVYEDLQKSGNPAARIENANATELQYFLIGLYFLRQYPTREGLERSFDYSKEWIAAKCWDWVIRIQALFDKEIVLNYSTFASMKRSRV